MNPGRKEDSPLAETPSPGTCVTCRQPVPDATERLHYFAQSALKPQADEVENFLEELQELTVKTYIATRQEDGTTDAQINRELAALKRMFNLAAEAEKIIRVPYIPMLTENNVRTGFFEYEEFIALRTALPPFVRPVATFGYYTGWRIAEILNLQWRQVNLEAGEVRLDPGTTKSGEGQVIYLDGELLDAMKQQRDFVLALQRHHGEILPWVFINPETGDRIRYFRRRWVEACKQTGLTGRLFHDFRRTAIRNMVRAGVPEVVAMQISGHRTRSVFTAIISSVNKTSETRPAVFPHLQQKIGTKPGQSSPCRHTSPLRRNPN